jgi:hypothetical protein
MLLTQVEKHLRERGVSPASFGRAAVGDPSFVFALRRGREPRPRTVSKVLAYIQAQTGFGPQLTGK